METLKAEIILRTDCLTPKSIKRTIDAMILTGFLKINGLRFELCIERGKFESDDVEIEQADEEADKLLDGLVGAK